MKQIYNFEGARPPVLNENLLRAEQERRKMRLQTILCTVAAFVVMLCIVVFAKIIAKFTPVAALVCIGYVTISIIGGGTAAIVYTQKGGVIL